MITPHQHLLEGPPERLLLEGPNNARLFSRPRLTEQEAQRCLEVLHPALPPAPPPMASFAGNVVDYYSLPAGDKEVLVLRSESKSGDGQVRSSVAIPLTVSSDCPAEVIYGGTLQAEKYPVRTPEGWASIPGPPICLSGDRTVPLYYLKEDSVQECLSDPKWVALLKQRLQVVLSLLSLELDFDDKARFAIVSFHYGAGYDSVKGLIRIIQSTVQRELLRLVIEKWNLSTKNWSAMESEHVIDDLVPHDRAPPKISPDRYYAVLTRQFSSTFRALRSV